MSTSLIKSPLKRVRVEENMKEENRAGETSRISFQEILSDGDTEIFSTLLPLLQDLDVLKTCRLVCKSWNRFACQALRKLPWVFSPIYESSPKIDNRINLLAENKKLGLPSPFRNFKVYAHYLRNKSFLRFLKYVRDKANNNYSIEFRKGSSFWQDTDPAELRTVFTSNLYNFNITKLVLLGPTKLGDGPAGVDIFQAKKIRLPHLNTLEINDDALVHDTIVILCETLCHYSAALKFLQMGKTHKGKSLKKVMSPGGMKSLEKLVLTVENPISYEDWKHICSRIMEIPFLKKLEMRFPRLPRTDWWYLKGFETIIEHFADSLVSLTGEPLPAIQNKKCFPKLGEIEDACLTRKFQFSYPVERFPLLKKATFVYRNNQNHLDYPCAEEAGSLGIKELYISCRARSRNWGKIIRLIRAAGSRFPNATVLSLDLFGPLKFKRQMLKDICNSVPKLTSLQLRVNLKGCGILSSQMLSVDDYLESGGFLEESPRKESLLDFPDLEKLMFGPEVTIRPDMLKFYLSKMPKLQFVSFYMKRKVSVEGVRDCIGDLKRMTIVIYRKSSNRDEKRVEKMKRLRIMLPSGGEIRKVIL